MLRGTFITESEMEEIVELLAEIDDEATHVGEMHLDIFSILKILGVDD